jgi:hypothetical protein
MKFDNDMRRRAAALKQLLPMRDALSPAARAYLAGGFRKGSPAWKALSRADRKAVETLQAAVGRIP